MEVDIEKLITSIATVKNSQVKFNYAYGYINGIQIPDDYPGEYKTKINNVRDYIDEIIKNLKKSGENIRELIEKIEMADERSLELIESLLKSILFNYTDTISFINDKNSQIKFYESGTGKQLIKVERVNGKDVFINIETGEIYAGLGAGGTNWSNDVKYLEQMRQKAREIGSSTGWFCTVDRDNFKTTVLVNLDGDWRVAKTYDCGTGRKGIEGIKESHTFTGTFTVDHKSAHDGPDDWWTCFIPYYKPDGTDFGQGFHQGYTGIPSFQSYGCTRLSTENAKWIYDNVPIETTVVVF